jgi:hypothetical protein
MFALTPLHDRFVGQGKVIKKLSSNESMLIGQSLRFGRFNLVMSANVSSLVS